VPRVDQNKPPKWTTLECQNHLPWVKMKKPSAGAPKAIYLRTRTYLKRDGSRAMRFESGAAEVYNSVVSSFPPGGNMPHYEFFCHACKKLFSKTLSLADYEKGRVVCPHCGSKKVEQRWSAFTVITSKKSA